MLYGCGIGTGQHKDIVIVQLFFLVGQFKESLINTVKLLWINLNA